jgi:hypothetical protein
MPDIELWLRTIGLEKYVEAFAEHDIDLDVVPDLSEQDLEPPMRPPDMPRTPLRVVRGGKSK